MDEQAERKVMTPAELLREAANVIETHGWRQGAYGSEETGFCAIGALRHAAGGSLWVHPSFDYATETLAHVVLAPREWNIPEWNDDPSRTKDEVVAALLQAAQRCEDGTE